MLPALVQRRWQLVIADLPTLSAGATLAAGNAIASSLNALVADNREFRNADEARREENSARTPEKCFGRNGVLKLLRLCQVTSSTNLPDMWIQMANEPRRQDGIVAVQQAFDSVALSLGLHGAHIPITPDVVAKIRSVALEMSNEEDLTTGIHPFTFAYMDTSEIAEAYATAEQYKMLHDDKGAPTLQDAILLATPGRVKLPRSLSEAHIYFQNFRVALHVLMGSNHVLTRAYDNFWRRWSTSQQYLLNVCMQQPGMLPMLAVRWVQLRILLWFAQQASDNGPLEAPKFVELLNQIRLHMPWEPTLPSHFYNTKTTPSQTTNQSPANGTALGTAAVVLSPPSTGANHMPGGSDTPPTIQSQGSIVCKATPANSALQKFVDMNLRVRDVIRRAGAANRVPNNNNGIEMCLAYHLKGVCNSNCAWHQDHQEHQPAEEQAMIRWCEQYYKPE
jgi:hypothetical protein